MRVIVRAFNEDGYHKDILIMDQEQVRMSDNRIGDIEESMFSGLIGIGGSVVPSLFPEMVRFEIVIKEGK